MLRARDFVPRRDQPVSRPPFHGCINAGTLQQPLQGSSAEAATERSHPIGPGHPVEPQGVTGKPEPGLRCDRPAEVGNDHPDAGDPVCPGSLDAFRFPHGSDGAADPFGAKAAGQARALFDARIGAKIGKVPATPLR